jgi:hypothetical protein
MIEARRSNPAFSPYARCKVDVVEAEGTGKPVYSVLRQSPDGEQQIIALTNCTSEHRRIKISQGFTPGMKDLFTGEVYDSPSLDVTPYQVMWLIQPKQASRTSG